MPFDIRARLIELLFSLPCVLIAITFHEVAHGYMANKLGDPTAKSLGRLTLNPLKHLDPIGAICMLIFRFGWAKPVPVNTRYFKKPRRDMALVSLAGPLSNILLAFFGLLLSRIIIVLFTPSDISASGGFAVSALAMTTLFFTYFIQLNASFAVFNLLPIPPLDGSRLLMLILPPKMYFAFAKYERYVSLVLLLLLWTGLLDLPLSYLVSWLLSGINFLVNLIPFL